MWLNCNFHVTHTTYMLNAWPLYNGDSKVIKLLRHAQLIVSARLLLKQYVQPIPNRKSAGLPLIGHWYELSNKAYQFVHCYPK